VRIEVDLVQEEGGLFRATAVAYPSVTVTGRTEKEALGLLLQAMGKHMKGEARKAASGS
jgi:hypothetical protein